MKHRNKIPNAPPHITALAARGSCLAVVTAVGRPAASSHSNSSPLRQICQIFGDDVHSVVAAAVVVGSPAVASVDCIAWPGSDWVAWDLAPAALRSAGHTHRVDPGRLASIDQPFGSQQETLR